MTQLVHTPETYAALRVAIDAGTTAVRTWYERRMDGCETDCEPKTDPNLGDLSDFVRTYIPDDALSLEPAQKMATTVPPIEGSNFIPTEHPDDLYGWPTFADRDQLLVALDKVTPPAVRGELGKIEGPPSSTAGEGWTGADQDGLSWWAVALAAGGVLAWLGRRHVAGFVLSVGAERLFRTLLAGGAVLVLANQAKKVLDAAGDAGAQTINLVPIIVGGVVVVGIIVTVAVVLSRRDKAA